jgi:hypothetical protein
VPFEAPSRPGVVRLSDPKEYRMRVHLEWIGENISRADAKWLEGLLARLSPDPSRDVFARRDRPPAVCRCEPIPPSETSGVPCMGYSSQNCL